MYYRGKDLSLRDYVNEKSLEYNRSIPWLKSENFIFAMDYRYAGTASYPRFNEEIRQIAELYGGTKITPEVQEGSLNYWLGKDMKRNEPNFKFPNMIPQIIQKFLNFPYEHYNKLQVREINQYIQNHLYGDVREVSHQIVEELESLVECDEGWEIY